MLYIFEVFDIVSTVVPLVGLCAWIVQLLITYEPDALTAPPAGEEPPPVNEITAENAPPTEDEAPLEDDVTVDKTDGIEAAAINTPWIRELPGVDVCFEKTPADLRCNKKLLSEEGKNAVLSDDFTADESVYVECGSPTDHNEAITCSIDNSDSEPAFFKHGETMKILSDSIDSDTTIDQSCDENVFKSESCSRLGFYGQDSWIQTEPILASEDDLRNRRKPISLLDLPEEFLDTTERTLLANKVDAINLLQNSCNKQEVDKHLFSAEVNMGGEFAYEPNLHDRPRGIYSSLSTDSNERTQSELSYRSLLSTDSNERYQSELSYRSLLSTDSNDGTQSELNYRSLLSSDSNERTHSELRFFDTADQIGHVTNGDEQSPFKNKRFAVALPDSFHIPGEDQDNSEFNFSHIGVRQAMSEGQYSTTNFMRTGSETVDNVASCQSEGRSRFLSECQVSYPHGFLSSYENDVFDSDSRVSEYCSASFASSEFKTAELISPESRASPLLSETHGSQYFSTREFRTASKSLGDLEDCEGYRQFLHLSQNETEECQNVMSPASSSGWKKTHRRLRSDPTECRASLRDLGSIEPLCGKDFHGSNIHITVKCENYYHVEGNSGVQIGDGNLLMSGETRGDLEIDGGFSPQTADSLLEVHEMNDVDMDAVVIATDTYSLDSSMESFKCASPSECTSPVMKKTRTGADVEVQRKQLYKEMEKYRESKSGEKKKPFLLSKIMKGLKGSALKQAGCAH